jgi:hypothetical protein
MFRPSRWLFPASLLLLGACTLTDNPTGPDPDLLSLTSITAANLQSVDVPAPPTTWRDVYDPFVLRHYHVQLSQADYQTIRHDETFDIKVPALFWMAGDRDDHAYQITIRRKSATPIGDKISYRIKFESQIGDPSVTRFYDIKSFSLENGDDQDVVREGLAWYLHRVAASEDYQPGLAAWATLTLHIEEPVVDAMGNPVLGVDGAPLISVVEQPQGVYLNVELPDKHFLRHRGLWSEGSTWLYKQDDIGLPELKEPDLESPSPADHSEGYLALAYPPFQAAEGRGKRTLNPTPNDELLQEQLEQWINMEGMLRLGAVNAFTDNPDELFTHGKNFFWADFASSFNDRRRMYFPWDLDAAVRNTEAGIYGSVSKSGGKGKRGETVTVTQHPFQEVILNHPAFRSQFNEAFLTLLNGPMGQGAVNDALTQIEGMLSAALVSDPNSKISNPAGYFSGLRNWVSAREASVREQISANNLPAPR